MQICTGLFFTFLAAKIPRQNHDFDEKQAILKLKRLATALHVSSDYLLYGQPPFTGSAELAVELLAQMSPVDRDFLSDMLLRLNRLLRESDPNHE